jgi:hypothetical protein
MMAARDEKRLDSEPTCKTIFIVATNSAPTRYGIYFKQLGYSVVTAAPNRRDAFLRVQQAKPD